MKGHYAPVNGLEMYFELHGAPTEAPPLVLLHGGLLTIDMAFGAILSALAERQQVIAVELQGHGHTADIDREIRLSRNSPRHTGYAGFFRTCAHSLQPTSHSRSTKARPSAIPAER